MNKTEYQMMATCAFGLEGLLKNELKQLKIWVEKVENGHVWFKGSLEDMIKANLALRTAEKIHLILKSGTAQTFDHLFDLVSQIDWPNFFGANSKIIVTASSQDSTLHSTPTIQSIVKKAIIKKLQQYYQIQTLPEQGKPVSVSIFIKDNQADICLNTSGVALHKRGYRQYTGEAPLKETLAASIILLSDFSQTRNLVDPFCGSGTLLIEAALIATNTPPGILRNFDFQNWKNFPENIFEETKQELLKKQNLAADFKLFGSDLDQSVLENTRKNFQALGFSKSIENCITLKQTPMENLDFTQFENATVATNPPYGERIKTDDYIIDLYKKFTQKFNQTKNCSLFFFTSVTEFANIFKNPSLKNRKLYNGQIKCYLYQLKN